MAIKIAGTTVISNSQAVVSMADIEGKYGQFHGTPETITTVLDMNKPIMTRTLTAATTFTASNIATGQSSLLLLDISSSGHLPTFPASIQWPGAGTEPDWDATGQRLWLIGFTCWDDSTIRATATGWGGTGVTSTVDLGQFQREYNVSQIWDESTSPHGKSVALMQFLPNGGVTYSSAGSTTTGGYGVVANHAGQVSWGTGVTGADYDIKFNFVVTNQQNGGSTTANAGNNTWVNLATARTWTIECGTSADATYELTGTISIRNASTQSLIDSQTQNLKAWFFGAGVGNTCLTNDMLVFVQGQGLTRVYDLEVGDMISDGRTTIGQYTQVTAINKDHLREGYYTVDGWLEITNDHPMLINDEWVLPPDYAGAAEYTSQDTDTVYVETTSGQFMVYKEGDEAENIIVSGNYAKGAYSGN